MPRSSACRVIENNSWSWSIRTRRSETLHARFFLSQTSSASRTPMMRCNSSISAPSILFFAAPLFLLSKSVCASHSSLFFHIPTCTECASYVLPIAASESSPWTAAMAAFALSAAVNDFFIHDHFIALPGEVDHEILSAFHRPLYENNCGAEVKRQYGDRHTRHVNA